ncbi:putative zinc-binding metallopeptidase [Candidatus Pelagibacter sp.]|nr:putative zinc-binding metallopeptidase [Candidatus Pelagibacter sp.]
MIINYMNSLRLILLVFIWITPVYGNSIYNLIKIPNLEIYEINTENRLKYFYAKSSFRLGVQKNIICENSNKEDLYGKYNLIYKNLNRYSYSFLKKINLKYIVLCENLSISGINTAGIPDNVLKTLILDIKFDQKYFERVIHHEVFHIINDQHKELFNENEWKKFNDLKFIYAKCSTCTENLGLDKYKKTKGFFTEYSKSTVSEDMAEVYSHLIYLDDEKIKKIRTLDGILNKKISYIESKIKKIDDSFVF